MTLSVDKQRLVCAKAFPWNRDGWGIVWVSDDGRDGADFVGERAQALALVRDIESTALRQR